MIEHHIRNAQRAYRQGDTQGAVDLLMSLIGAFPDDPRGYLILAEMMRDLRQPEDALAVLAELPEAAVDGRSRSLQALALAEAGRADDATRAVAAMPADPTAGAIGLVVTARVAAAAGDSGRAAVLLNRALSLDPDCAEAMTFLGEVMWNAGNRGAALDLLGRGLTAAPWRAAAAVAYHHAVSATGAYDQAEPVFRRVFEKMPEIERTTCLYIDILLRLRWPERAFDVARTALAVLGGGDGLLDGAMAIQRQLPAAAPAGAPLVSLCMIVKNEQARLARCLASVAPVVDEMLIVDTGSDDRTADVAKVFGARVIDAPWTDDFAAARNAGLAAAAGGWVLIMDADETLSARDHEAFRRLLADTEPASAAFVMTTRNYTNRLNALGWQANGDRYPDDAEGFGWFPSDKVRLFPNRPDVRFSFPVHELVEPSLAAAGIPVRPCGVPIHHYGKLDDAAAAAKGEQYFRIGMEKLSRMAEDPAALKELAVQALNLGRWREGVDLWERLDRLRPACADVLVNLGTAYLNSGRYEDAVRAASRAVRLAPDMKEAHYNQAFAHLHAGAPQRARSILVQVCRRYPDYLGARFLLAAATAVTTPADGAAALQALAQSPLGDGLAVSCRTLADGLRQAGQDGAAAALMDAAAAAGRRGAAAPDAMPEKGIDQ